MASLNNINSQLERSPVGMGIRKIAEIVNISDFTDGEGTSGHVDLDQKIPAGAFVIGSKVNVTEAFTGDTAAKLEIGISTDPDAFADGIDVFTTGVKGEGNYEQAQQYRADETTVRLTVTGNSDFTDIAAGRLRVDIYYLSTEVELSNDYIDRYDV